MPPLPVLARELDATVCWFRDTPLRAGDRLALKQGARTVRATVQGLHTRLDPETLEELDQPVELVLNDIGEVTLRTSSSSSPTATPTTATAVPSS